MPYWSSSRVGPVGSTNGGTTTGKQQQQPRKGRQAQNKKKGITMEDLKKQTALRLAQEQGRDVVVVPDPSFTTTTINNNNNNNICNSSVMSGNSNTPQKSLVPPPAIINSTKPVLVSTNNKHGDSSEMGANPKLPHGLTVQELKEMTKARLHAEAAEFIPSSVVVVSSMNPPPPHHHHPSPPSTSLHNNNHIIPPHHLHLHQPQPSSLSLHSTGSMTVSSQPSLPHNNSSLPPPGFRDWENASVSTTASSLNGNTTSSRCDTIVDTTIPFCRSASYPNQQQHLPLRQRAATLSPRPYVAPARNHNSNNNNISSEAQHHHQDNRARTASLPMDLVPGLIWGFSDTAPTSTSTTIMSHFFCDVNDDLASILKLSGAEEDDDDDNNNNDQECRAE